MNQQSLLQQQPYYNHNKHPQHHNHNTSETFTDLQSLTLMLTSALAILSVFIFLCMKKIKTNNNKLEQKVSKWTYRHKQYTQQRHQQQKPISHKKSYSFNLQSQYNLKDSEHQQQQHQRALQHKELIDMLHHHDREKQLSYSTYSIKQQQNNFLNNLKKHQFNNTAVYLDDQDIKQRKQRKQEIQKLKNQLLQKEQQQLQVNKKIIEPKSQEKQKQQKPRQTIKVKKDQTTVSVEKKEETLTKQQQKQKEQMKKTPTLGESSLFKESKPSTQQPSLLSQLPKQPQPGVLNFGQVRLGLPSQKALPDKKVQQAAKKEEKPLLFPALNTGGSLFGQQPTKIQFGGQQKSSFFDSGITVPQQQINLFAPKQSTTTLKPTNVEKKQQDVPQKGQPVSSQQPVLPQPQQPSTLPQPTSVLSAPQKIQKKDYLQMLINYSKGAKQHCELKKTKTNNFGRSISNLKQIYDTSIDFINTINVGDAKEVQTLACVIYDFLINKTIPTWPKQQGWEMFPPRAKNETKWKISITTYVMKLNIYRAMGHETLWLIVFGKLLSLLEFSWKRTQQIPKSSAAYKELDLVKNGYFSLQKQDDMAPKYFTRLDLVTYFLFCMTTFDPQLVAEYLCQTAGQDKKTLEEIRKLKYKWSYNYFWILVETILENKTKTYFKPILYMNILSSMYLQIRKNKLNPTDFKDFDHLRKFITKEAIQSTTGSELQKNEQVQTLAEIDEENRDFRFDGEDFLGQIETLNFYFKEKDGEYKKASTDRKGFEEFERRCSVFDFFKSQSKIG